ncbi:MAG: hypothetical protein WB507_03685 [Solirubrobacterales bacterium]
MGPQTEESSLGRAVAVAALAPIADRLADGRERAERDERQREERAHRQAEHEREQRERVRWITNAKKVAGRALVLLLVSPFALAWIWFWSEGFKVMWNPVIWIGLVIGTFVILRGE